MKKKVYVGCALTGAPGAFVSLVESLKQKLREKYEVMEFLGLVDGTSTDVFERDSACVRECDLFLAICDVTSLGLGIELGIAACIGKPTIAVAHNKTTVSRMVQGITNPRFTFKRYESIDDVLRFVDEILL